MAGVETVLMKYAAIFLHMTDVQLLAWVLIGTVSYDVLYLLFRFLRTSRTREHFPRTLIGASIAGFMLSYTLVLLGGVVDEKVLENIVAQPAGQTILLLYSMVVIVITFTGLFAGYSRVFKIGNGSEKARNNENGRETDRKQRITGYLIVAILLGIVAKLLDILADILKIVEN